MLNPLIDIQKSVRTELSYLGAGCGFRILADPENMHLSAKQWKQLLMKDAAPMAAFAQAGAEAEGTGLDSAASVLELIQKGSPLARRQLIQDGMAADRLDAMPDIQVVAIHQRRVMQRLTDDMLKWFVIPFSQAFRFSSQQQVALQEASFGGGKRAELLPIIKTVYPDLRAVRINVVTFERNLAGLQTVEALRMQLSASGELPPSLAALDQVPAALDPATGQLFRYQRRHDKGFLVIAAADDPIVRQGQAKSYAMTPRKAD